MPLWNLALVAFLGQLETPSPTQAPTTPTTYSPTTQATATATPAIVEVSRLFRASGATSCTATMNTAFVEMSNRPADPRTKLQFPFVSDCKKLTNVLIAARATQILDCSAPSGQPTRMGQKFPLRPGGNLELNCTLKEDIADDEYRYKVDVCTVTSGTECDPTVAGPGVLTFELEIHVPDK